MAMTDPTAAATSWANRLAQSGDKIKAGIEGVTTAPGAAAAAQAQVWQQNTVAAADKWKRNTANVSLQDWKDAAITKGVPRIAAGAQASQAKMATFLGQLFPHIEQVKRSLKPRGNLEQNIQRSADFARGMSTFRKQG